MKTNSDYFIPHLKKSVALALLISVQLSKAVASDSATGYDPHKDYTTNASGTLIYSTAALEEFRQRATNADGDAQVNLGFIYSMGQGVPKDNVEAYMWFVLAGAHENTISEELSSIYQMEYFVRDKLSLAEVGEAQSRATDFFWRVTTNEVGRARASLDRDLNKMKQGDPDGEAANSLGLTYYLGVDVPQNYKEALKWYRQAAEKGNDEAFYRIGEMYEDGKGVPKDVGEAIRRYKSTAEYGLNAIKREKAAAKAPASDNSVVSASSATTEEINPIKITNASAKVIETNRTFWKWSWKVTLKNNTPKLVNVGGVAVQFVDSAGYEIDHDSQLDIDVPPNQEVTATGTSSVDLPNGRNVARVRAKTF